MLENNTQKVISPAERARLFQMYTRQHKQSMAPISAADSGSYQIPLPKSRLLSKVWLLVEGTLTLTHASGTALTPGTFGPANYIKNVELSLNNGFSPFQISGKDLYLYNLLKDHGNMTTFVSGTVAEATASRAMNVMGTASASGGTANPFRILLELPLTVNDRDPQGLILLQNPDTVVNCNVTLGSATDFTSAATGFTMATSSVTITPILETFSIPAIKEAQPDLGILKIVNTKTQTISGAGQQVMALPVGLNYRKMILVVEDSSGGEADSDLTTDIELIVNQTEIPYRVDHKFLAAENSQMYGRTLPAGVFVFDFSYQGLANYGGVRDMIDTERISEFWLRLTAAAAGNMRVIYECLARLSQR